MKYAPLTREEVIRVVEGKGIASRIPVLLHAWCSEWAFPKEEDHNRVKALLESYPQDAQIIRLNMPLFYDAPEDDPDYRWLNKDDPYKGKSVGLDEKVGLDDWAEFDDLYAHRPNPNYAKLIPDEKKDGRYCLIHFWNLLFENHWQFRGMENALTDFYFYPEETHKLYRMLTDFIKAVIVRAKKEVNPDGIFTSDDIGSQHSTFFSKEIFNTFYKPYYKEIIDCAHENGMHVWLHTCGNIQAFIPDFIEMGLDVIHPIQKYTMDEKEIAQLVDGRMSIWAGFDVQQTIPYGTPDDVRREVKFMMDTYFRKDGRLLFTAGNGITGDTPVESLDALFETAFAYGTQICQKKKR